VPTAASLDAVRLEVWWSRLAAIADEAATAMLHTAFSTIIRESNDDTVVLVNRSGERIADCRAGIPAFAVLIGSLTRELLTRFPLDAWRDADCVITNDPWIGTGHLPDMAMVTPIFYDGRLVGFAGTAAHLADIGGTPSMGPTELISEGLLIPPVHLYRACCAKPAPRSRTSPPSCTARRSRQTPCWNAAGRGSA
jgi:N-methylhydantoinase B